MLTVLFATRNGENTLPAVLEAFTKLQPPTGGWKLVVADNGSSDRTPQILSSFQARLPLTYVLETRAGKNSALNTALAHMEGDLAVFTDDDVFPRPDWLVRLREAADVNPSYSMFGGAILPRWQVEPPSWMKWVPPGPAFAITDPAWSDGPIEAVNLFGPNLAIRGEIFLNGTGFDPSIGPQGANYAMGSETELVQRLARDGHKAWHVPRAIVEHFIRDYQMSESWVLGRARRYGRGSFRRIKASDPLAYPDWLGLPMRLTVKLVKPAVKRIKARLSFDKKKSFLARWEFNYLLGYVVEAWLYRSQRLPHGGVRQAT